MWPLSEAFDDSLGRWDGFAPWGNTIYYNNVNGFLTDQAHVDIRTFRRDDGIEARPQTALETTPAQSAWESTSQTEMELEARASTDPEGWTLATTAGVTGLTVGKIASRGGWSGLQLTTTTAAIDCSLVSSIPADNLDISNMERVSVVFPDVNNFTMATSTIQFTSDPDGEFGQGADSLAVAFSNNLSVMPQLALSVASFNNSGFDNTRVTGVKIVLKHAATTAGQIISILAIRALGPDWEESSLDFDTRRGAICVPVTLDGAPYGGTLVRNFEFIRGDGSQNDPIPADGAYNVFFYPGGSTSPDDASVSSNVLAVLLREIQNTGAGTGSFIVGRLLWSAQETVFECQRIDMTGGAGGTRTATTLHRTSIGGPLDSDVCYIFRVELVGTQIIAKLYITDFEGVPGEQVWALAQPVSVSDFVFRNGRIGFMAGLLSRDAYVFEFESSVTNYALLRTAVYKSLTPVDGAKLAAAYSTDANLFKFFSGNDLFIDTTKTLSGDSSFRSALALLSNSFIVDDWHHTYLDLQIFVGGTVTTRNQPKIYLNTPTEQKLVRLPRLQPNKWNPIRVDLGIFQDELTGIGYSFTFQPGVDPDRALNYYWINKMTIGRRRVAWALRATHQGQFREFRDLVNDSTGALHLNPNERGTDLQLQAAALTTDAWISGFKLLPRYSGLGNPVYDVSANR